ncbi:MAG: gliding motility-associated C-terminal domain-containing protein, partial [Bacteroidetes bacterium]|nr:gliding motility-associated C-terminal domain-containing protein [Bacteroidota bacterium]
HPKVDATFNNLVKNNCKADTIILTHDSDNEVNKWTWFVNGQMISPSPKLIIAYTDSSLKNISLIVANATCKDTSNQTFTLVHNKVKAKFNVSNNIVCPTDNVSFVDNSTGNISTWKWDFGNGVLSTSNIPSTQSYLLPTDKINPTTGLPMLTGDNFYTTTAYLIVGNATPCYDTTRQILKITSNCLIQVPTAFTPNGDGLNDNLYPLNTYKASKFNFRVYNRGGNLIFESSTEGSKWNGNNYLRVKQPAGTYVWTLNYTDKDSGKEIFLKGTTVLIR